MAIDRETSLRRAEKLLRQGRLDGAIEEYLRVIEDQPSDWNTANLLGDLYVRAGQIERAAVQYSRIADHFAREGFFPKAIALYRKVLKIKPDDDHALLQSADIAVRLGLLADAKAALSRVIEHRLRRGDRRGAAETTVKLAELDPGDIAGRLQAARATVELSGRSAAVARFCDVASELLLRGRAAEAVAALLEALGLDEQDPGVRRTLVRALLDEGDADRARLYATEAADLKAVALALRSAGRATEAVDTLLEVVRQDPADRESRIEVVRLLVANADWTRAAELLADQADADAEMVLLSADVALRSGRVADGRELLERAITRLSAAAEDVVAMGCRLAPTTPEAGFVCIEVVTNAAVAARDWPAAAGALQRFLDRAPGHVPTLTLLVDVSVDGDLADTLLEAQANLADAFLGSGHADEARVIAEDLVSREPWSRSHIERLRQALGLLGEENPDEIIAEHLSAEALFAEAPEVMEETVAPPATPTPDLATAPGPPAAPLSPAPASGRPAAPLSPAPASGAPAAPSPPAPADEPTSEIFRLSASAIDLRSILGEEAPPRAGRRPETLEVDLSEAIGDLKRGAPTSADSQPQTPDGGPSRPEPPRDLEGVFDDFRQEVQRDRSIDVAEQHLKLAAMYQGMGMLDETIKALQVAVRSPRHRFEAASQLARMYRDRGMLPEAIEWFERAAEAPASSMEAGHALLYDLGDVLERVGESARALAVFLELQTDAGRYRDVGARIERLSRTGD